MKRRAVLIVAALALVAAAAALYHADADDVTFATDRLDVATATARHPFVVELATTGEQRARGLMFREALAPDAGMLFLFEAVRPVSFWMKNTLIPLDMIFIAPDGRIVAIATMTTPLSEEPVPSGAPVLGVLEVAGGTVERLGIAVGDRVIHPSFAGAS